MDIMNIVDRITKMGKSATDLAEEITTLEAGYLWQTIFSKYNVIRLTQVYHDLVEDVDFKLVVKEGLEFLQEEARILEGQCKKYGIAVPDMPPEFIEINNKVDAVNDKYIFEQINRYEGNFPSTFKNGTRSL